MAKSTILLADNDPNYLKLTAELLEKANYVVITAESDDKLLQLLGRKHPDLAILDVHLKSDKDENDVSGILLARTLDPEIPKLLLTSRPSVEVYRMASALGLSGQPSAIGLIDKRDKQEELLAAVQSILQSAVKTGWKSSAWWSKQRWQIASAMMLILSILTAVASVTLAIPMLLIATGLLGFTALLLIGIYMD